MSASNPLTNSPHPTMIRHPDMPYDPRPKRSNSAQFERPDPRGYFDPASRMHDLGGEATFVPTSLSEHLLERTYLEDVVRPLVRALVQARMTYGYNGEANTDPSQAYVDLEKLRHELERSTQRARHAEQERDDLARRLDLVGGPDALRAVERHPEPMGPGELTSSRSLPMGIKRPRPAEYEPRPPAPGSATVSVNVVHSEGPGASINVANDGPHRTPIHVASRPPHHSMTSEPLSPPPPTPYAHPSGGPPRHRPLPAGDMHHDPHDPDGRTMKHVPLTNSALEAEYAYADERERAPDRYGPPPANPPHRPPLSRYAGARSPPGSNSYHTSGSERSSMPSLTHYPSTSSTSSFGASHYSAHHPYDHEAAEEERSRKMARLRPGESLDHLAPRPLPPNYIMTPPSESSAYPVRKLASTKNRTCSNCAAPHDAKFRRGPNGPGTLCDRCGSRWKKFKEQEMANRRGEPGQQHDRDHLLGGGGGHAVAGGAPSLGGGARLSSSSASSASPMDPVPANGGGGGAGGGARTSDESASNSHSNGRPGSGAVSPNEAASVNGPAAAAAAAAAAATAAPGATTTDNAEAGASQHGGGRERDRERSASVDQLIDD